MSQDFMDPEIFVDFIVEAREHLETIEPNLLKLEKSPDNLDLLNDIFRPMHSLKGASGFLGLGRMNSLAHKAENVLDELRRGDMAVNAEIMDVILSATDALRQMIENLETSGEEGDVDTGTIEQVLDSLYAGEGGGPKPETVAIDTTPLLTRRAEDEEDSYSPINSESWIASQPAAEPYSLTAYGEGHIRDFMEELRDITGQLGAALLKLEIPEDREEILSQLFRQFHNLKGNAGIIGFREVNHLTHDAESLLNLVKLGQVQVDRKLIDLLLLVVDVIDALAGRVDRGTGEIRPFDVSSLLTMLRDGPEALERPKIPSLPVLESPVLGPPPAEEGWNDEDLGIFVDTVTQQRAAIALSLDELEKDGSGREYADALFRSLTTLQNCCNFMGLTDLKVYAERTAGLVDQARSTGLDFSLMVDLLRQECSILGDMLDTAVASATSASAAGAPSSAASGPVVQAEAAVSTVAEKAGGDTSAAPSTAQPQAAPPVRQVQQRGKAQARKSEEGGKTSSTIRVDHEKLDHLMNLIGELIINRNRFAMLAKELDENAEDVSRIAQHLTETTYSMARISDDLQDTIMKVRMVPVSSVFSRFPRLVRDLSRKSAKDVDLIMEGEETELDKSVVEVIGDPLVHLIRNSMDHGIEPAEVRIAKGKDPKGRVWLRAYHKGNSVAIEIEDDGKGINPEVMREVAVRKGIISAEDARNLDDREAIELIFAPGFSSAETVTDISGRGVGMDVVRTNIKNLKGSITISSEVDKGTRFTLSLPLTLAIIDALMVKVDRETFAIPLDAVSETTKIEAVRLTDVKGRKAVTIRGEVLGVLSLAELLGLPCNMEGQEVLSVVVIQDNERRLGLVVDRLLERQEVVIKPLGAYLGDCKGISGATIMGDGSVILILDPHEVYIMATSRAL